MAMHRCLARSGGARRDRRRDRKLSECHENAGADLKAAAECGVSAPRMYWAALAAAGYFASTW